MRIRLFPVYKSSLANTASILFWLAQMAAFLATNFILLSMVDQKPVPCAGFAPCFSRESILIIVSWLTSLYGSFLASAILGHFFSRQQKSRTGILKTIGGLGGFYIFFTIILCFFLVPLTFSLAISYLSYILIIVAIYATYNFQMYWFFELLPKLNRKKLVKSYGINVKLS